MKPNDRFGESENYTSHTLGFISKLERLIYFIDLKALSTPLPSYLPCLCCRKRVDDLHQTDLSSLGGEARTSMDPSVLFAPTGSLPLAFVLAAVQPRNEVRRPQPPMHSEGLMACEQRTSSVTEYLFIPVPLKLRSNPVRR